MPSTSILVALASGAFALVGGYIGARLTRRTEYEKWLRQQRSIAFGEFLARLYEVRVEATNAIYSADGDDLSRGTAASEAFASLRKYEGVARLYLRPESRMRLTELTSSLAALCTMKGGPAARSSRVQEEEGKIQQLLESELESVQWKVGRLR